jgi:hypothetical protein
MLPLSLIYPIQLHFLKGKEGKYIIYYILLLVYGLREGLINPSAHIGTLPSTGTRNTERNWSRQRRQRHNLPGRRTNISVST